jgi:hypothetical protein
VQDPTAQQLRIAVHDFLEGRGPQDLVVVYLSCHGLTDMRRRLYFAAADTVKTQLAATGVESSWLYQQLEESRARSQVLILDCCFSGAFVRGFKGTEDLDLQNRLAPAGRGLAVLTASRAQEYSFEGGLDGTVGPGDTAPGSVFTSALLDGLRTGAADVDGHVTVDEAYDYAYRRVRAAGAAQTPQRWLARGEGQIVLARNPAWVPVAPASVPQSLQVALDSPSPTFGSARLANSATGWPPTSRAAGSPLTWRPLLSTMAHDPRRIAASAAAVDDRPRLQAAFDDHARRHAESVHPEHPRLTAAADAARAAHDRVRRDLVHAQSQWANRLTRLDATGSDLTGLQADTEREVAHAEQQLVAVRARIEQLRAEAVLLGQPADRLIRERDSWRAEHSADRTSRRPTTTPPPPPGVRHPRPEHDRQLVRHPGTRRGLGR